MWKTVIQIPEKENVIYNELVDFADGDLVYNFEDRYVVENIIFFLETMEKVIVLGKE